jgi:hypothetical protein
MPRDGEAPTRYSRFGFMDQAEAEGFGRSWVDPMI